jgi:hypothetical protein
MDASIVSVRENTPVTAKPFWRSGRRGVREKAPPLTRRKEWTRRLGILCRMSRKPAMWQAYPAGRSSVPSREHAWTMRGGNPLPRASRWHHYRGRHGNDRRDRLVTSHRSSMQASMKGSMVSSPVGPLTALNRVTHVSYDVPPIVCKSLEYCHLALLIRSSNTANIMNFIQASPPSAYTWLVVGGTHYQWLQIGDGRLDRQCTGKHACHCSSFLA